MSDATTLTFGGQSVSFSLSMKLIMTIERLCGDKSIVIMYEEMASGIGISQNDDMAKFVGVGAVRVKDVYEVIRCAAIGGGMSPNDAASLVDEYVDGRPYSETVPVAWAILSHTIMDVRLKKKAEDPTESLSPTSAAT